MKGLIVLFATVCVAFAAENYISGGGQATRNAHPFVVSVQQRFLPNLVHICGGVILNKRWVLSAAACAGSLSRVTVIAGRHDLQSRDETEQRRTVLDGSSIISADGNLALIHLASNIVFDNITSPAKLDENNVVVSGKEGTFAGWPFRASVSTERTQILRATPFRVMADDECRNTVVTNIDVDSRFEFCTTSMSGIMSGDIASCDGNLGGPLFIGPRGDETVLGILIDYPKPCTATGQPTGLFARISAYTAWINAIVNQP